MMNITRRNLIIAALGTSFAAPSVVRPAKFDGPVLRAVDGGEEFWLATDAYGFGYPLVTMEMTRRIMTNVASPEGTRGPWDNLSSAEVS